MRNLAILVAAAFGFLAPVGAAWAFGGTGNISPEESPYAVLEPQTLGPAALPQTSTAPAQAEEPPAAAVRPRPKRRPEDKSE
ncbi:MAG: hypothetical protein ABSG83_07005 [Roseiarcus sp.]|jgi:hypothetical protein